MNKLKKRKLQLLALCTGFTALTLGVLFASGKGLGTFVTSGSRSTTDYRITLDSSNKITSAGDHVQHTKRGSNVTFTYSNVASSTSGHVTLNSGGTLVNKDIITSISAFYADYSGAGTLKARIAYTTKTWGEYFTITSGAEVPIGSNPYFLEIKADGGAITLNEAVYKFTCTANPDAEEHDTSGTYTITFKDSASDGSTALQSTTIGDYVTEGSEYVSSWATLTRIFPGTTGLKLGSSSWGLIGFNINSSSVTHKINAVTLVTAQYGSETQSFEVYVNDSDSYESTTPDASEGGRVPFSEEVTLTRLDIATSTRRAYLKSIILEYGEKVVPGAPDTPSAVVTGFGASDTNKDSYTTNSIFTEDNVLSAWKTLSDSTQIPLTKDEFSYEIRNSLNVVIDPTEKFPEAGDYTLTVSYEKYIPQNITLHVGEYVYVTDVSAALTHVVYNTADVFGSYVDGRLTATISYSNDTSDEDVNYVDFGEHKVGLRLLNPKGITYDISKPFGTAGNWTVRVYSIDDETTYYDIEITVNAIPVIQVTLNKESHSMYPEDTVQLTTTINPDNATNPTVSWSSSNDAVATVDQEGLVTAVAVGGATITATAVDGSNVYGTCVITVNARPASTDVSDKLTNSNTINQTTTTYSSWSNTGASTAEYAGQSAGGSGTIQLRSNNSNSGIVTTSSGGKVKKVTVEWNSGTSSGRTLDIYGKNSAYSAPTDLYNSSTYGTKLGSISYGTATELTISSDYEFVGVRSSSGAMYLDSLTFKWASESATPVEQVYPTAISLSGASPISLGETSQLTVNYTPANTNVKNVTFSSNNTGVATVSPEGGLITGVSAGTATITATAQAANNTTVNATFNITVSAISVTSVSLNQSSASIKVGESVTLVPTIQPTNATNKAVTWTSSNSAIATVSTTGQVNGIAAGTATITVRTSDGNKTATCTVTVTESQSAGEESFSITRSDLPGTYSTSDTTYTASSGIKFKAYNCAGGYGSKIQFKASGGYIASAEGLTLQSLTIKDRDSNTLTVYASNTAGSFSTEITGNNDVYDLTGYSYFKVIREGSGAGYCSSIIVLTGTPTPTDPTGIILDPSSAQLVAGGTKQLEVSYVPANANQNKEITWTSSNTNVATVSSSGLVTVKSNATAGQTATITAKLTKFISVTATCTVTVAEQKQDDHTVLIYMCGADLESKNGLASGDIYEILKVSGQPDDVNIVIETGGASSWSSSYNYGISSTKLERWHVSGKSLVKDDSLTYASMGLSSTLQSFIEYGLKNYPAERTGLVFWNHGGGMRGVCYDEKKNDDVLKNSEIRSAVSGALSNCGMSGQKLEWVGYDACLMAVQDIAETNSQYFNYMIASEESEAGYGWDYDNWVDDLYSKKATTGILKAIVDSFISDNGGANSSSGDQTLSYLDLSYASAYKTAWENLAAQLNNVVTSSNRSSFNSAITKNVKHYADSDYDYFCTFDAWDFIDKLANNSAFSSFRVASSYITAVKNAHANLVAYNVAQKGAGVSKGLCMYWPNSTQYSDVSTYYTTSETNFTTWRSFCVNKGYHA